MFCLMNHVLLLCPLQLCITILYWLYAYCHGYLLYILLQFWLVSCRRVFAQICVEVLHYPFLVPFKLVTALHLCILYCIGSLGGKHCTSIYLVIRPARLTYVISCMRVYTCYHCIHEHHCTIASHHISLCLLFMLLCNFFQISYFLSIECTSDCN